MDDISYVFTCASFYDQDMSRGWDVRNATSVGASFVPLAFETFGRTSNDVLWLIRDLVGKATEINQQSYSHWKRRLATILQKENALFILNSSAHVLLATHRFDPSCKPNLDEVLKDISMCLLSLKVIIIIHQYGNTKNILHLLFPCMHFNNARRTKSLS